MTKVHKFFMIVIVGLFVLSIGAYACPNCKDAYEIGSKQGSIGESYSYSVLFFLGMFTTLLVGGTLFLRRQILKAQQAVAQR